jgi:hypothetical protein
LNTPNPETLTRAYNSYQANQKQWTFLGYKEDMALAMLVAFFSLGKVRNPSQKPLNVLNVLGKRQVQAIADAVKQQREQAVQQDDEDSKESDA